MSEIDYECPICYEMMKEACILVPSGHSYCCKCISESLYTYPNLDPLTGKKYHRVKIIPNHSLRILINNQIIWKDSLLNKNDDNSDKYNKYPQEFEKEVTLEFNNGVYTGNINSLDQRHGKGKFSYENGDSYVGDWEFNEISGKGCYQWSNGDIFIGSWLSDKMQGEGVMKYASGDTYQGPWVNDEKFGLGKMIYSNNDIYEGEFLKNKKHGTGKYTTYIGDTYEGLFRYDYYWGKGSLKLANGESYTGDFKKGLFHGKGIYSYKNNNIDNSLLKYDGGWIDDKKHGFGYETHNNMNKFIVEYECDKLISQQLIVFRGDSVNDYDAINNLISLDDNKKSLCCSVC